MRHSLYRHTSSVLKMCTIKFLVTYLSILLINEYAPVINAFRVFSVNDTEVILALKNENIKMECKADMPMGYCGFVNPAGKRYSISDRKQNAGDCSIELKATINDTGEWRCHIGGKQVGVEVMKKIQVRVVGNVAAINRNEIAIHGKPVTLACATVEKMTPVRYCRFEPPNSEPFSIDSSVTYADPILNRYYFPTNKSLDRGDCAMTIHKVKYEDAGYWLCGAGLNDGREHTDVIRLDVEGLYTMSTASATGIASGSIGIGLFLAVIGFIAWKKRRFLGTVRAEVEEAEAHELEQLPQGSPRGSPHRSPLCGRGVPRVTIQSPSETGMSPLVG